METAVDEIVLCALEEGVATITLNRPERQNAWTPAMTNGYTAALDTCARDSDIRAIVVTGAGGHWCSGGDGALLAEIAGGTAAELSAKRLPAYLALTVAKPVIAAIDGVCFGVGLFQALCCDVRFAGEDAKFSTAFARRGLPAEAGVSWLLPRAVGSGHAADLLFSARVVRADEALRLGLVNRVVPTGETLTAARDYARTIASRCAPESIRNMKRQLQQDATEGFVPAFARAERMTTAATASESFREGVGSWQQQRPPAFPSVGGEAGLLDPM